MTPPRWVDEHGRPRPTRPCPRCQRVIPVNRWPVKTLATQKLGVTLSRSSVALTLGAVSD